MNDKASDHACRPATAKTQTNRRIGKNLLIGIASFLVVACTGAFILIPRQSRSANSLAGEKESVLLGYIGVIPVYGNPDEIVMPGPMNLDATKTIRNATITRGDGKGNEFRVGIHDLLNKSPKELDKLKEWRLEAISAIVADGLPRYEPKADGLPAAAMVDDLAKKIGESTERDLDIFREKPQEYDNSEAQFRMCALITYLRRDFGIGYDPDWSAPPEYIGALDEVMWNEFGESFWKDPSRLFMYGAFKGHGTCSSLPILTVAIGRRLGYPLKLVSAKEHLFARWESGNEVFNIECTSDGFVSHPNDYYRKWPHPLTDEEIKQRGYLCSMTRADELAMLFHNRVLCLMYNGRLEESHAWTAKAFELQGKSELREGFLRKAQEQRESNAKHDLLVRMIQDGRIDLKPILKYVQECSAKQQQRLAGEKMDRSKEIVLPEYDRKKTGLDNGMLYSAASSLRRSDGL